MPLKDYTITEETSLDTRKKIAECMAKLSDPRFQETLREIEKKARDESAEVRRVTSVNYEKLQQPYTI